MTDSSYSVRIIRHLLSAQIDIANMTTTMPSSADEVKVSSLAGDVPADWSDKVMHGSMTLGSQVLMGGDVAPDRYEAPKGFSLSLQINSTPEAERIFHDLVEGGQVVVPLAKTFWAERFGMVVDRFGVPWLINCEGADQRAEV